MYFCGFRMKSNPSFMLTKLTTCSPSKHAYGNSRVERYPDETSSCRFLRESAVFTRLPFLFKSKLLFRMYQDLGNAADQRALVIEVNWNFAFASQLNVLKCTKLYY